MRFLHSIDILLQFSLNAHICIGRNITLNQIKNFSDKHLCTLFSKQCRNFKKPQSLFIILPIKFSMFFKEAFEDMQ